ncbi:MAG: nucleoside 2-deoxyribosyltransferase [archaeon]
MLKIFFGCSMRGGYANASREELIQIQGAIKELGFRLATEHQTKEGIFEEESRLNDAQIHDRDFKWLQESDIGIFEISNPSLGVGGEITDIVHLGKPVLCLFKKHLGKAVSAYIKGKQGSKFVKTPFECRPYQTIGEAKEIIRKFAEKNC